MTKNSTKHKIVRGLSQAVEHSKETAEQELRRWCIEQAIRIPSPMAYQGGAAIPNQYGVRLESDVLGRAKQILDWIKSAH